MPGARARPRVFAQVAADVAALTGAGTPVVLVSSGAIAMGLGSLGREQRSRRLPELQAASAIGQSLLLRRWEAALGRNGLRCAQVLLTVGDIHRRDGYLNARRTLETLLRWGRVPVVNENDSTATDEITFGDNDALAAQVAVLLKARLLVLLTDIDGLHDRDPRRARRRADRRGGRPPAAGAAGAGRQPQLVGVGRDALEAGRSRDGQHRRRGRRDRLRPPAGRAGGGGGRRRRRHPLPARPAPALRLQAVGALRQAGARAARGGRRRPSAPLSANGTSLLAVGLLAVEGTFAAGDAVRASAGRASRSPSASHATRRPTCGSWSGTRGVDEAVHRDNLVVL